jgi:hypothetical protein
MSTTTAPRAKAPARRTRRGKTQRQLDAQSRQLAKQQVQYWAREVRTSYTRTVEAHDRKVEAIVHHGTKLNEAKTAVGHGNWLTTLEKADLEERSSQDFMLIAANPVLANPKNFADLPATVSCLRYLASKLLQPEFLQGLLDEKRIHSEMTKPELVELIEPAPTEKPRKNVTRGKRTKGGRGVVWTNGVNAINEKVTTFFAGSSETDATKPEEVVWRRDDESIAFTAPQTDSNGFHNRIANGAVVLFPLGQKFALFYQGERRDVFAAAFGELGTLAVAWGG